MSSEILIRLRGLGKCYTGRAKPSEQLKSALLGARYHPGAAKEFWALKDINIDIHRGEAVGIVGRNGSGKSTLLEIIAGTQHPTTGQCEVQGRVAALLALGAGFNPEMTGRENVRLNTTLMGCSQQHLAEHIDDILNFADIGSHIDEPVKHYSSGMYARLGFAVAINVDPDILIIDEALAVGDEAFQRRCFQRIADLQARGTTLLFVSHSAATVVELCGRALLLDQGERLLLASPKAVIGKYQKLIYADPKDMPELRRAIKEIDALGEKLEHAPDSPFAGPALPTDGDGRRWGRGTLPSEEAPAPEPETVYDPTFLPTTTIEYACRGARIEDPHIVDEQDRRVNILRMGGTYRYRYTVTFDRDSENVQFGMMIKGISGIEIAGMASHPRGGGAEAIPAGARVQVEFQFRNYFLPNTYFLNAGVLGETESGLSYLHRILDAVMFRVDPMAELPQVSGYFNLGAGVPCRFTIL
jgi:lipopolysaccharide transport system ATP-binding protein